MNDLRDRFRSLDDLSTPDLWREVEARAQAMPQRGFRSLPSALVGVMLLLLALAIAGAALIGSGVIKLPAVIEASATPTSSPSAEPASGRIVFGRKDRFVGDFVVHVIDPNGSGDSVLLPGGHECPRWSPDGKDVVMTPQPGHSGVLENAGQPNSSYREFSFSDPTLILGCAIWSPDGSRLAYEAWDETDPSRNGIYTTSAVDGSDLQRLTSSPVGGHDIPGDYSADGSQLFFARWDGVGSSGPLMVVGIDGSDPTQVTSGDYGVPRLSPDGSTILALRDGTLYLVGVDGSSATPIFIPDSPTLGDFGPAWSPDGSWIVLSVGTPDGVNGLARVHPDGSGLFRITDSAVDEYFPDWAP
jgi:Tol biopolymer transport system component